MKHKMIIFGAGASHGSDLEDIPPLSANLFDDLTIYDKNGWGSISLEFAQNFKPDFENGMVKLSEKYPHSITKLQRSMASFFYKFTPKQNNLYRRLANYTLNSKWNGCLVSINYERLLELSLIKEGLKPMIGNSSNENNSIELILPHGCCNIFCESIKSKSNKISMNGFKIQTRGNIARINNDNEFEFRIKNNALPPVMSYFEPDKRTTSGINLIENQRYKFHKNVLNAEVICIIGIKVRPRGRHIWEPIAKTTGKLLYCSGKKSGFEFSEWKKNNRNNIQDKILHGYFSDCFEEICKDLEIS